MVLPEPTVRILFYTDDDYISLDEDIDAYDFGVRILHDLLVHDDSDRATFEIDLVNRHEGGHAANKLTPDRLATYDQVWFFGHRQANTSSETQNELVDSEVTALADWMTAGGVLMTGDHSNPRPNGADPSLASLLGLGRAIGHKVPRAGSLRVWDGGPPQYAETSAQENYNTQVPTPDMQPPTDPLYPPNSPAIEGLDPQEDEWPQNLILTTYPVPGDPLSFAQPYGRRVHELFCGRTRPITVFPDHMHEGQLDPPQPIPHQRLAAEDGRSAAAGGGRARHGQAKRPRLRPGDGVRGQLGRRRANRRRLDLAPLLQREPQGLSGRWIRARGARAVLRESRRLAVARPSGGRSPAGCAGSSSTTRTCS